MTTHPIWALHLAATLFMFGLIWMVQIVHYPMLGSVGEAEFTEYNRQSQTRTGWVVGPPMLLEVGTLVWLLTYQPALRSSPLFLASAALLAVIWASTFFWQVPLHGKLLTPEHNGVVAELVHSNWLRTWAWSARAGILLWMTKVA